MDSIYYNYKNVFAPAAQWRLAGGGAQRATTGNISNENSSPEGATDSYHSAALSGLGRNINKIPVVARNASPSANFRRASSAKRMSK